METTVFLQSSISNLAVTTQFKYANIQIANVI